MGKPDVFDIITFNPQPFYLPGSWVEGVVILRCHEKVKARAVRLKMLGKEHVSWSERHTTGSGDNRRTKTRHYSRTVQLIESYLTLWGYPKHTDEDTPSIAPGSYVFPFSVQVPVDDRIPPSSEFSGIHPLGTSTFSASVSYSLVAYIDIPMGFDVEVVRWLKIVPRIPLSADPSWIVPTEQETEKEICCWCCAGGKLKIRVRCLRHGVMLNDSLLCTAEIVNKSNTDVVGVELLLVNEATFHAEGHTRGGSRTVAAVDVPVFVGQGKSFSNFNSYLSTDYTSDGNTASPDGANAHYAARPFALTVPIDIAPGFSGHAITSRYSLVCRVRLKAACSSDPRLSFPVTICTQAVDVPMMSVFMPSILNPSGQPRSATLLTPATSGMYPVCFSFDGLDYRAAEQFETDKQVSYPSFFDPSWDAKTIPASLSTFSPALMQAVAAGQQVPIVLAPGAAVGTGAPMAGPMPMPIPMPMPMPMAAAPPVGFYAPQPAEVATAPAPAAYPSIDSPPPYTKA